MQIRDINPSSFARSFRDLDQPLFILTIKNTSGKDIRAFKIQVGSFDGMEELNVSASELNSHVAIKDGKERKIQWNRPLPGRIGWVVLLKKVLFEDGSTWTLDASRICYGEKWKDGKHSRLTKVPWETFIAKDADGIPE